MAQLTLTQVALLLLAGAAVCRAEERHNSLDPKHSTADLCKSDSTRQKLCAMCAQALSSLPEDVCCTNDVVRSQCHGLTSRSKRDIAQEPSSEMNRLMATLSGFRVASRARPFLGKRDPLGEFRKRPRNNFLGKRDWSDGEYSATFQEEPESEAIKRGARPFLGKKARPFLGKRAGEYDEELLDDLNTYEEEKRMRPFLGKRGRRPFLGKRYYDDEEYTGMVDGLDDVDKRGRRPFLGKRGGMRPFLGKREAAEGDVIDSQDAENSA